MDTSLRLKTIPLVLALAGCAEPHDAQHAIAACSGIANPHSRDICMVNYVNNTQVGYSDGENAATLGLLGATAVMNGYTQSRPITTTCFTTGMMTQCSTP